MRMIERSLARECCLQSLYEADVAHFDAASIIDAFYRWQSEQRETRLQSLNGDGQESGVVDLSSFYKELFATTKDHLKEIDTTISELSKKWDLEYMSDVERYLLRMSVCLIMKMPNSPVVMSKSIEISKMLFAELFDFAFYKELFTTTMNKIDEIDCIISEVSKNWDISRMPAVDRCILRMAVCEMMILASAPVAVVIDEAIELAKTFSTDKSGKFVNGVLDNIARHNKLLK